MTAGWRQRAACAGAADGSLEKVFFPAQGRDRSLPAKAICALCPVTEECLAFAMATEVNSDRFGVWGGLSATERKTLWFSSGGATGPYGMRRCNRCDDWYQRDTPHQQHCSEECRTAGRQRSRDAYETRSRR